MDSTDQDAVDDLFDSLDSEMGSSEDGPEPSHDISDSEDTGETEEVQAQDSVDPVETKAFSGGLGTPGVPWKDYIPKDDRPRPQGLKEWLVRGMEDESYRMKEAETKVQSFFTKKDLDHVFLELWQNEANDSFILAARHRMRKEKYIKLGYLAAEEDPSDEGGDSAVVDADDLVENAMAEEVEAQVEVAEDQVSDLSAEAEPELAEMPDFEKAE